MKKKILAAPGSGPGSTNAKSLTRITDLRKKASPAVSSSANALYFKQGSNNMASTMN
jgi:hypothetical protein